MKCPIFSRAHDGFCLREACKYYAGEKCNYAQIRDVRKAALKEDREELEKALLKSLERSE